MIARPAETGSSMLRAKGRVSLPVWTRRVGREDRQHVQTLLWFLPKLYPNGQSWLDRRLSEVMTGAAYCSIAGAGNTLAGVLIETPKGPRCSKISTYYVHPRFRRLGIGSGLLQIHKERWRSSSVDAVHITVSGDCLYPLSTQLANEGFRRIERIPGKYREHNVESVFQFLVH
jgi:GNAT superfamily N-acetyltransferase